MKAPVPDEPNVRSQPDGPFKHHFHAASSRAVVGLPTDIGTSAARTVGSLAAGPVGCKHPRGKQPPAADRRGRALTSGFAQTQRCGSAEPRQPRDRIPGERLFRRAPEPAMPMATFRGSASAITGGAATNRFPRWHASTTIARCAQLARCSADAARDRESCIARVTGIRGLAISPGIGLATRDDR